MNISRTDLNLFVVFEAIYVHGGVTRAAEILNLSQPTISHALGRLRDRLNDPLFVRQGQRLVPTTKAQNIIGPVRDALKLFESTLDDQGGFTPETADMTFRIGMRSLLENAYLVPLVQAISDIAPSISIGSVTFSRRKLEQSLASGEINLAIDVFLPLSENVHRDHIGSSKSVVIARPGHPLTNTGKISLDDYLAADHVHVSARPEGTGPEDIALARLGKNRQIRIRCQQLHSAMSLVRSSDLLLTMAEPFARQANIEIGNQILSAPFDTPGMDTYLYWHANQDAEPANQWLRNLAKSTISGRTDRFGMNTF